MTRKFLTPIVLPADPAAAMEAATKQYVDGKLVGGGGTDEVWIGPDEPVDPALELWYDTDDTTSGAGGWNTAWGVVASVAITTNQGGIAGGSYVDVTGMTLTFNAVAGRRYKATATFIGNASTNADWNAIRIQQGTVTLGGSQQTINPAGAQEAFSTVMPPREFTAGPVTLKVTTYFGAGVGSIPAAADLPNTFIIEDVGPAVASATVAPTPIMQWNAAWGIVAQAAMKPSGTGIASAVATSMAVAPITITLRADRRYAIRGRVRALVGNSGAQIQGGYALIYRDGAALADCYYVAPPGNTYTPAIIDIHIAGDGLTHTYDFLVQCNGTAATTYPDGYGSYFLIEDVGPVSGAVAVENPTPAWIPLTLNTGWGNYGGGFAPAGYRKIGDEVSVRGLVNFTGTPITDMVIGNLPPTHRPPFNTMSAAWISMAGASQRFAMRLDVFADGRIGYNAFCFPSSGPGIGAVDHLNLDGIRYSVTP